MLFVIILIYKNNRVSYLYILYNKYNHNYYIYNHYYFGGQLEDMVGLQLDYFGGQALCEKI